MPDKPDYGIDAPHVIRNLLLCGFGVVVLCLVVPSFRVGQVQFLLYPGLLWMGVSLIASGVLMMIYSKAGKFRQRDRMLGRVAWSGREQVLDVGAGRGLLLVGAAKKLTTGRGVGIDIWNQEDLSGNNVENLLRNLELEGCGKKRK